MPKSSGSKSSMDTGEYGPGEFLKMQEEQKLKKTRGNKNKKTQKPRAKGNRNFQASPLDEDLLTEERSSMASELELEEDSQKEQEPTANLSTEEKLLNALSSLTKKVDEANGKITKLSNTVYEQQNILQAHGLAPAHNYASAGSQLRQNYSQPMQSQQYLGNMPFADAQGSSPWQNTGHASNYAFTGNSYNQGASANMQSNSRHGFAGEAVISDKMKSKIWNEQYVNFLELLGKEEVGYALQMSQDNDRKLEVVPIAKKKVLKFEEWSQAFNYYRDCLLTKYHDQPHKLIEASNDLTAYRDQIYNLYKANFDWRFYDMNLRKQKRIGAPFAEIRNELHVQAIANGAEAMISAHVAQASSSQDSKRGKFRPPTGREVVEWDTSIPFGFCFAYHTKGRYCNNTSCPHDHRCPKCHAQHRQYLCVAPEHHSRRNGKEKNEGRAPWRTFNHSGKQRRERENQGRNYSEPPHTSYRRAARETPRRD